MARANFARGFEVGFNAVDSVIRQSDARKERERRNQREDEKWSFEKDRLENERSYQQGMKDVATVDQGVAIGAPGAKNFAAGKADQEFLADQDAAIAELQGRAPSAAQMAAGSGNQIMDRSDPRAQNTRAGYLARAAEVQRQHGKMDESIKTEELANAIRKSGTIDSLDYLFASGGDAAGAQKIRESAMGPMGGTLIAEKTTRKGADGTEYPDFKLSIRDNEGNVRDLGSAMVMRYYAGNPAEYHKLLQSEAKGKRESDKDERTLAQGDRRLDIAQQQANTTESWRRDQMAIARERAANAGSAAGEAPGFQPLSTTDEKAVREFLAENLPQGADINTATDIAARVRSANPNMSLSQAAQVAATPGLQVETRNSNRGPVDVLILPEREVVVNGKKQTVPSKAIVLAPGATMYPGPAKPPEPPQTPGNPAIDKALRSTASAARSLVTPSPVAESPESLRAQQAQLLDQARRTTDAAERARLVGMAEQIGAKIAPSPKEVAAQPAPAVPPRQQYSNAINALRAEQERLLQQARSARSQSERATLERQAARVGAQADRQAQAAGVR